MIRIFCGKFIQTYLSLSAAFEAVDCNGQVLAHSFIPDNRPFSRLEYSSTHGVRLTLQRDVTDELDNLRRLPNGMLICDGTGRVIGRISRKSRRSPVRYQFFEVECWGKTYVVYSIGLGKQGIKYPVYEPGANGERQIALIEKPAIVVDMKDVFDYCALEDTDLDLLFLFILYTDFLNFGNYGVKKVHNSKSSTYLWTFNSFEKGKYDAMFKQRIASSQ